MIRSLADTMHLSFHRIQFTPDLMPADITGTDITGTDIIQESKATGHREMVFEHGPIFSQIVLADEINRTPPKTQAALLEAMQEHVKQLVLDLVRSLRPSGESPFAWAKQHLGWGPGPRACQQLVLAAKARTLLEGRYHVTVEDIQALALPVLRHRIVPSFTAESDGLQADDLVLRALQEVMHQVASQRVT